MKTRWYFIAAAAALAGFAVVYQDFCQRDDRVRADRAAAEAARVAAARELAERDQRDAIQRANAAAAERRARREVEAARVAGEQIQRENLRASLAAARDEIAATRGQRDRLERDIADAESRLRNRAAAQAEVATETKFLAQYLTEARASLARVQAVVERIEQGRVATNVETAP